MVAFWSYTEIQVSGVGSHRSPTNVMLARKMAIRAPISESEFEIILSCHIVARTKTVVLDRKLERGGNAGVRGHDRY